MDYVARAKSLLMGKARTGALLVLPLAAAVQYAQATVANSTSLPTGGYACTPGIGTCTGGDQQLSPVNGLSGVGFFLTSPYSFNGSSYLDFSSTGPLTSTSSGGNLASGTTLTSDYNFSISNPSGGGTDSWSLIYEIFDSTTGRVALLDSSSSGSGTGTFSRTFADQLTNTLTVGDTLIVSADISLNASGGIFSLSIPGGLTLDVGSGVSAAPEPSTLSFAGLALAIAGIWYRLRRRRTADLQ